VSPSSLKAP